MKLRHPDQLCPLQRYCPGLQPGLERAAPADAVLLLGRQPVQGRFHARGKPAEFDDQVGMSAPFIEGVYPQKHMQKRTRTELCLYDRPAPACLRQRNGARKPRPTACASAVLAAANCCTGHYKILTLAEARRWAQGCRPGDRADRGLRDHRRPPVCRWSSVIMCCAVPIRCRVCGDGVRHAFR